MTVIRVDTTQVLLDYEGNEIIRQRELAPGHFVPEVDDDGNERPFTFRNAIFQALNSHTQAEQQAGIPAAQKEIAFTVTCLCATQDKVELTREYEDLIRARSGIISNTLVHGRICEILDNAERVGPLSDLSAKPPKAGKKDDG